MLGGCPRAAPCRIVSACAVSVVDPFKLSVALHRRDASARARIYPSNLIERDEKPAVLCYGDVYRSTLPVGASAALKARSSVSLQTRSQKRADKARLIAEAAKVRPVLAKLCPKWPVLMIADDVLDRLPIGLLDGDRERHRIMIGRHLRSIGWVRIGTGNGKRRLWCRASDHGRLMKVSGIRRGKIYNAAHKKGEAS